MRTVDHPGERPAQRPVSPSAARRPGTIVGILFGCVALILTGGLLARAHANFNRPIGDDVWSHAAAVRALADQPGAPLNPFYGTAAASNRFTPFHLAWGLWVRLTGRSPMEAFTAATFVNWIALALAAAYLGQTLFGRGGGRLMLLTLVLGWGGALNYSGSYALPDLPSVAAYPSMLAFALGLVLLAQNFRYARGGGVGILATSVPLQAAVVLIHPLVGAYTGLLSGVVWLTQGRAAGPRSMMFLAGMGLGTLAAFLWPYYPLISLLQGEMGHVANVSQPLTHGISEHHARWMVRVLRVTWPGLLLTPYLWREAKRNATLRFAGVLWGISLLIFLLATPLRSRLGDRLGVWMHFPLQIAGAHALWSALADGRSAAAARGTLAGWRSAFAPPWTRGLALAVLLVCAGLMAGETVRRRLPHIVAAAGPEPSNLSAQYAELLAGLRPGEMVLARPLEAWPVAAFGGHIVYALRDDYYSPDRSARQAAVQAFFSPGASSAARRAVLRQWAVDYVLYHRRRLPRETAKELRPMGTVAAKTRDLVLLRCRPGDPARGRR